MKPQLVIFSGAGISAESGIKTFRDYDGLWENHRIEDVATPEAFSRNPELVLEFYNMRRSQLAEVAPNEGHFVCAQLESIADVTVITQNVDDLHERAGSTHILHLHGELDKAFDVKDTDRANPVRLNGKTIRLGDSGPLGGQIRPYIVWFGEMVQYMDEAAELVAAADYLIVVGTSLQVWPAAGLVNLTKPGSKTIVVDPHKPDFNIGPHVTYVTETAVNGMPKAYQMICADLGLNPGKIH